MMFSDITFKWDSTSNSYRSVGDIGISNIGNHKIHKYVPGHIELKKRGRSGDELFIYLEPVPGVWYFFRALGNVMNAISSDNDFNNEIITNIKDKDKKLGKYQFQIGGESNKREER